jgi:LPS-assembly protein
MIRSGEWADRLAERTPSCWAVLAAALAVTAAPSLAFAQTRPAPTPAPVEATEAVVLEADTVINDEPGQTVTAEGNVEVRFQGRTLRANRLIYNLATGTIHAQGQVEIVQADGSAEYADEVQVDEALKIGVATELRARFGASGSLVARSAIRNGEDSNELRHIVYTACPICTAGDRPPTWTLRARRAIQDHESRTISYQGMVMEVVGVPVLYLPYFAHPDPTSGRHSGFLVPDAGTNRRLGAFYEQPYYWAISPSQDMTVGVRVHSHVHPLLGVEYRKRFWSGDLQIEGTITNEQEFDGDGETSGDETLRSSIFAEGLFRIDQYWKWGFGAERVTDDLYLRRYNLTGPGEVRGPYIGDSKRLISQLYAVGQDSHSYSQAALVSFQGLRENDSANLTPLILPFAEIDRVYTDPWLGGQVRLQANTAVLRREDNLLTASFDGSDSARVSFGATWRNDVLFGPGLVLSPFAQAREDVFRIETTEQEFETFGRTVGLAGAELSWPFVRPGSVDVIVEPVAMAAWATEDADDPRIINEDSLSFELDDSNLFRANAAPNYDLWEPGGRVSLGMRATARSRTGQSASVLFGRRWRSEAAPGFTVQNNLEGRASDWVGAVQTDLGRNFGTEIRFRLEDESLELQRLDADVRAAVGRFSAHARYFRVDETLAPGNPTSEVAGEIGVELARGWRLQAGLRRDLDSDINLRQELRAIYEDDCTFLEIAYTRSETRDRLLDSDEGLQIRFGLRSIGVLGGGD